FFFQAEDGIRDANARHPGVLPGRTRNASTARGDAVAEDRQTCRVARVADVRDPTRAPRSRNVHARRARVSRPVGEPIAAYESLVAVGLTAPSRRAGAGGPAAGP